MGGIWANSDASHKNDWLKAVSVQKNPFKAQLTDCDNTLVFPRFQLTPVERV